MKYRTKTVEVDALQYTGENGREVGEWSRGKLVEISYPSPDAPSGIAREIHTLTGETLAAPNDWIIESEGVLHSCKPDFFNAILAPL